MDDKRQEYEHEFRDLIRAASSGRVDEREVFRDFCHAAAMEMAATTTPEERRAELLCKVAEVREKYGVERFGKLAKALAVVVRALEQRRADFLGHVYEAMNASVKSFGQFFTPVEMSRLMARIAFPKPDRHGMVVKVNDPACGAGVLLIEGAEEFVQGGGRQGDLLIYAEDIEQTAAEMALIQFNLLGYAAVVTHKNSLSNKTFGGPWHTVGYFMHKMPMRLRIDGLFDTMKNMTG